MSAAGEGSAAARAAEELRRRIASAGLLPGERLGEVALAAELGVSRNSLREAFTELSAEGLLVRRPHRGVFVSAPDADTVRVLYRMRRILQLGALDQGWLTPAAVARLERAGEILADDPSPRRLGDANHLTHLGITDLAASPELTRVMSSVLARTRLAFHPLDEQTRLHALFADRNRWIVERLLAEDLPAVRAMFGGYLDEAEAFVLQHLDGSAAAQAADVPA